MPTPKSSSSNVARAADILLALGEAPEGGFSLGEIAARVGGTKPPVHRALTALAGRGFVEPGTRRGSYRLGPAVYALAARPGSTSEAAARWRPALVTIAARTGHSTYLMARAGLDALCIDMETGTAPIQTLTSGIGGRVPLGLGPGSLAVLSLLPSDVQDAVIAANFDRYLRDGRTSAADVRGSLSRIASDGMAIDHGGLIPGVAGLAIPIYDRRLGPIAISQALPEPSLVESYVGEFTAVVRASAPPDHRR